MAIMLLLLVNFVNVTVPSSFALASRSLTVVTEASMRFVVPTAPSPSNSQFDLCNKLFKQYK